MKNIRPRSAVKMYCTGGVQLARREVGEVGAAGGVVEQAGRHRRLGPARAAAWGGRSAGRAQEGRAGTLWGNPLPAASRSHIGDVPSLGDAVHANHVVHPGLQRGGCSQL